LLPLIASEGHHWLGLVGVAFAAEAAFHVGNRPVAAEARDILALHNTEHVLLGTGTADYGPVSRYLGLALATLGEKDEAVDALTHVATNPLSGPVWRSQARDDLILIGGVAD
jgi:hypothetical protein